MRRIDDALAADPIIAAALAARGIDHRDLPQGDAENDDEFRLHSTQTLPWIQFWEGGEATIRWYDPRHPIGYAVDDDGGIVTAERLVLPETVVDGLAGRRLSEVLSFPGAERMRIVVAVNSSAFPSDVTDLRMTVEPVKGDATC